MPVAPVPQPPVQALEPATRKRRWRKPAIETLELTRTQDEFTWPGNDQAHMLS